MTGAKRLRVPGHTLIGEGAPHTFDGKRIPWSMSDYHGSRVGYGKCSCGNLSKDMLTSAAARKRWHRTHKDRVLAAQSMGVEI